MPSKRGNGEGTIYREVDGRWHGQAHLPNGRRRSVYGKTRREVQEKLAALRREIDGGLHGTKDGHQTLREFAWGWLEHHSHRLRSKTYRNYESIYRIHLDILGDIKMDKLKPVDIQSHYTRKLRTLSPTSVEHIHAFIHVVLDSAVRLGVIPRNYADYVDAPGLKPKEMCPLSEAQAQTMLSIVQADRYEAFFVLALATGMREGELLGLRWGDVDWPRSRVRVAMTLHVFPGNKFQLEPTKSRSSMRTLPLPAYAADALARWRKRQDEEIAQVGEAWGNTWDLVFTTESGLPVRYDFLMRHFRKLTTAAGLPQETRIHDLRHTFATLLIERGVPIKVVSELLGHSSIAITLATYGHVTPRMRDTALEQMIEILRLPEGINLLELPPIIEDSAD